MDNDGIDVSFFGILGFALIAIYYTNSDSIHQTLSEILTAVLKLAGTVGYWSLLTFAIATPTLIITKEIRALFLKRKKKNLKFKSKLQNDIECALNEAHLAQSIGYELREELNKLQQQVAALQSQVPDLKETDQEYQADRPFLEGN